MNSLNPLLVKDLRQDPSTQESLPVTGAVPLPSMPPVHDRSAMAKAVQWVSRIMTVALEMVLPGIAGVMVDRYFDTRVVFTLLGFLLGMAAAGWHLAAMTRLPNGNKPPSDDRGTSKSNKQD